MKFIQTTLAFASIFSTISANECGDAVNAIIDSMSQTNPSPGAISTSCIHPYFLSYYKKKHSISFGVFCDPQISR